MRKFGNLACFLVLLLCAETVFACSCDVTPVGEAFRSARDVFVGRVLRSEKGDIEFRVIRSWKGASGGRVVEVKSFDLYGCDRDIDWIPGKDYLVFVDQIDLFGKSEPTIRVDCNRTAPLNDPEWNRIWQDPLEDIDKFDNWQKSRTIHSPSGKAPLFRPDFF